MIIRVIGPGQHEVEVARESLNELARTWGHDLTTTNPPAAVGAQEDGSRAVDPISLTALILSIPSAALAVSDLADRIQKRRRARDLVARAHELSAQNITLQIVALNQPTELVALDPDQLLDLVDQEDDSQAG